MQNFIADRWETFIYQRQNTFTASSNIQYHFFHAIKKQKNKQTILSKCL